MSKKGITLDTGALLALDHRSKAAKMLDRLETATLRGGSICIPAETLAQAWRTSRQVRLARLMNSPEVEIAVMTPDIARMVGQICAKTGHSDVVDVHVVWCARERGHGIATSDPDDITKVDPSIPLIHV